LWYGEQQGMKKISLDQFGELLGTTKATVSRFENGERTVDVEYLQRMAEVLGRHISDFFHSPNEPSADALLAQLDPKAREEAFDIIEVIARRRR
jgi:transcriptional regulator with XRE-family HTH domain